MGILRNAVVGTLLGAVVAGAGCTASGRQFTRFAARSATASYLEGQLNPHDRGEQTSPGTIDNTVREKIIEMQERNEQMLKTLADVRRQLDEISKPGYTMVLFNYWQDDGDGTIDEIELIGKREANQPFFVGEKITIGAHIRNYQGSTIGIDVRGMDGLVSRGERARIPTASQYYLTEHPAGLKRGIYTSLLIIDGKHVDSVTFKVEE